MTLTAARAATWLFDNVSSISADESAGDIFMEIKRCVDEIERMINRPVPTERYLGKCTARLTDNYGERVCDTQLTSKPNETQVQCPICKTTHRVDELHEQQIRATDVMSFTLSELYKLILPINREYVPLRTLQHWVCKNLLVPTGYDSDGEPRFMLAHVRQLRDKKRQTAPTGAVAHEKNKRAG